MRSGSVLGPRFASLCLAKIASPGRSWKDSAVALGFQAEVGPSTARSVTKLLNWQSSEIANALEQVADSLVGGTDFRRAERNVRGLASEPGTWFPGWAATQKPRRRAATVPYAITWMWTEVAHADLETSPGWTTSPTRKEKAYYRAFSDRLKEPAMSSLRVIAGYANTAD